MTISLNNGKIQGGLVVRWVGTLIQQIRLLLRWKHIYSKTNYFACTEAEELELRNGKPLDEVDLVKCFFFFGFTIFMWI